jgi:hypothetical protein
MNFSWSGVVVTMFFMGILYETYQHVCFSMGSGHFANAVGLLALMMQMLMIESQLSQYLGGIVRQLVLTFLMMTPVLQLPRPVFRQTAEPVLGGAGVPLR